MSFGLGFLAGIGKSQRDYNQREIELQTTAEQQKNKATADLLHDFMLRDDVTPEVRQAALQSLMSFSQTKGMPGQKHRAAAMEPLLTAFNAPRQFASPDVQDARQRGQATADMGQAVSGMDTAFPGAGEMGDFMASQGTAAASTPDVPRRGFLSADEKAVRQGRASGLQMRALTSTLGGSGMTMDGPGGSKMVMMPDGKFRLINPSTTPVQARYVDSTGNVTEGFLNYDHRTGHATDGSGSPVIPIALMTRDGYMSMPGVDSASGVPTRTVGLKSDFRRQGPIEQFVRKVPVRGETVTGEQTISTYDPAMGAVYPNRTVIGKKANVDLTRERTATSVEMARRGMDLRERQFAINYDPESFYPTDQLPSGLPTDTEGNAVGLRTFAATKEPGSVLQRASSARSVVAQAEDVAKMVEDPKNADLMGKVSGRISELLVEGPQTFATKWIGPIGTDDKRLSSLHAAVKSISDLLTTVHGRRAEKAAESFQQTMALVDSPAALAAAIRQYQKVATQIAGEGARPIVSTTKRRTTVPARPPAATSAPATHVYIPGKGITPVVPSSTAPTGSKPPLHYDEPSDGGD